MIIDTNQATSSRYFSYSLDSQKGHNFILVQCSVAIKERKDTRKKKRRIKFEIWSTQIVTEVGEASTNPNLKNYIMFFYDCCLRMLCKQYQTWKSFSVVS